jgi:hypothetical protein
MSTLTIALIGLCSLLLAATVTPPPVLAGDLWFGHNLCLHALGMGASMDSLPPECTADDEGATPEEVQAKVAVALCMHAWSMGPDRRPSGLDAAIDACKEEQAQSANENAEDEALAKREAQDALAVEACMHAWSMGPNAHASAVDALDNCRQQQLKADGLEN